MSTIHKREKRCALCGRISQQLEVASTNAFGPPDLDLRPPEMQRSTMAYWPECCPGCGYTGYDIEAHIGIPNEFLRSGTYTTCDGIQFTDKLAIRFYRIYLAAQHVGHHQWATNALINAAWACDDAGDAENAIHCRKLLIPYLQKQIDIDPQNAETLMVVKSDVMRRAGLFSQLMDEYAGITFSETILNAVLAFELSKAAQADDACYTMADI